MYVHTYTHAIKEEEQFVYRAENKAGGGTVMGAAMIGTGGYFQI